MIGFESLLADRKNIGEKQNKINLEFGVFSRTIAPRPPRSDI